MPTQPGKLTSRIRARTRPLSGAGGRRAARAGIIVLCVAPLIAAGVVLAGMLLAGPRPGSAGVDPGIDGSVPGSPAPSAEVDRVHGALHEIASRCRTGIDEASRQRMNQNVQLMVEFSRRYPDARFRIDDETGRPEGLLLVARNALERCAPEAAAKADSALPPEFRRIAPSPPG